MHNKFFDNFVLNEDLVDQVGFNPYYLRLESGLSDKTIIEGREVINLAANNYLGVSMHPGVHKKIKAAVDKYGSSLCGTPIATGYIDLFKRLEVRLAEFAMVEDCVILPSCYQANSGIFKVMCGKEDVAIIDQFAHSSLVEGVSATGCKIRPYVHNSTNSLRQNLEKTKGRYRFVFIISESVFSTEGAIAPFKEINELAEEFDAIPVIDDSHGIGVIGEAGRGILSLAEIDRYRGIYTASLGKAIANAGGIIGGKKEFIEYVRYSCSHMIYSTAVTPATLAGVEAVLDIIENDHAELSKTLWTNRSQLFSKLKSLEVPLVDGQAPIISIIGGSSRRTWEISKTLFEKGILTTPFIYPSVPKNEGKVRMIAGANISQHSIDTILKTFEETFTEYVFQGVKKTNR